jgi:hypothetical protein
MDAKGKKINHEAHEGHEEKKYRKGINRTYKYQHTSKSFFRVAGSCLFASPSLIKHSKTSKVAGVSKNR